MPCTQTNLCIHGVTQLELLERRRFLRFGAGSIGTMVLAACEGTLFEEPLPQSDARGRAALLLPLTGTRAVLGQALREAATLGGVGVGTTAEVEILDAGETPESAVRAALAARDAGAQMLIGPIFADQARAVATALSRRLPIVSLSNDESLAEAGLFVYGVTPRHSAGAVLSYAATQGLSDVAIAVPPGAFGDRAVEGARVTAAGLALDLRAPLRVSTAAALRTGLGQTTPAAVYLPSAGPELPELAAAARNARVQVLGSAQWSALNFAGQQALDGAWYAAPDPLRFEVFARTLQERGATAGIVAGLVFDAVEMARLLGRLGQQTRRGLLRDKGFRGVLGPYRFDPSGRVDRDLAVLGIDGGTVSVLRAPEL